jgi:hypothetical protein
MTDDAHGLVLFGSIAGAAGVVKVHALAGDEASLLYALVLEVLAAGARLVICEIPDDAPFAMTGRVCRELGFDAEGRVADYFRDGVALLVLTWRSL